MPASSLERAAAQLKRELKMKMAAYNTKTRKYEAYINGELIGEFNTGREAMIASQFGAKTVNGIRLYWLDATRKWGTVPDAISRWTRRAIEPRPGR